MNFDQAEMTIDGQAALSAETFQVIDPANGTAFATAPDCTVEQLDQAVAAARRALPCWRDTSLSDRQAAVKALGKQVMAHKEALATLLQREQGKPAAEALADVLGGAYWCRAFSMIDVPVETIDQPGGKRITIEHVPVGVTAAIAPWNFPILMALLKSAPALVAGNTVVLKPSPYTPLATLALGVLARDILPPGVFNVISGSDQLGPWLSAHPGIDKISFTGSTATGRRVMASAAGTLKRLTLELGGNDACIVMPDVDIDAAADSIFDGAFRNAGQMCVAVKRLYVHDAIYDAFARRLAERAERVNRGDGVGIGFELGPLQNRAQYERVLGLIADSRDRGHSFLSGAASQPGSGYHIPITLIDNPPDDARIVVEEQFGPVLPMLRFTEIADVVRRANVTPFALGAQIWARDEAVAQEIAARLEAGTVWINECASLDIQAPFGGHKQSGIGVEAGLEGLLAYTNIKTIVNAAPDRAEKSANQAVKGDRA